MRTVWGNRIYRCSSRLVPAKYPGLRFQGQSVPTEILRKVAYAEIWLIQGCFWYTPLSGRTKNRLSRPAAVGREYNKKQPKRLRSWGTHFSQNNILGPPQRSRFRRFVVTAAATVRLVLLVLSPAGSHLKSCPEMKLGNNFGQWGNEDTQGK